MSRHIATILPTHPDGDEGFETKECEMNVTTFAGPGPDYNWVQLSLDNYYIRLRPIQVDRLIRMLIDRHKEEEDQIIG